MDIHVCSLSRLAETARLVRPARLLSVLSAFPLQRPDGIAAEDHLHIAMGDITAAMEGQVLPCAAHVESILDFARGWRRDAPLLVHCYAGISRSTAAAYAIACALAPERAEDDIARELRTASPSATPNTLIVEIADAQLRRQGRMVAAIRAIGRGADAFEGTPFRLGLGAPR